MTTVYSAALKRQAADGKKRAAEDGEEDVGKVRRNKQRVLLLPSRGITTRMRHLVNDVEALLPHAKKGTSPAHPDAKLDSKSDMSIINELAELNNCNVCVEAHAELYVFRVPASRGSLRVAL